MQLWIALCSILSPLRLERPPAIDRRLPHQMGLRIPRGRTLHRSSLLNGVAFLFVASSMKDSSANYDRQAFGSIDWKPEFPYSSRAYRLLELTHLVPHVSRGLNALEL